MVIRANQIILRMMNSIDQKTCPYCAETIHIDAIKCKHCGEFFDDRFRNSPPIPTTQVVIAEQKYRRWSQGVAALLSFVIPGAGQIYKGNVFRGLLWFVIVAAGYFLLVLPGIILHLLCILAAATGNPYRD